MEHVNYPPDDILVIIVKIDGIDVKHILADSGSSMEILFLETLTTLRKNKGDLEKGNFLFDQICREDNLRARSYRPLSNIRRGIKGVEYQHRVYGGRHSCIVRWSL